MGKVGEFLLGTLLVGSFIGWNVGGGIWVADRWWDLTTGRKLAEVDRLIREDKPREALRALRPHLKEDPTDRRLLYKAAGLYLETGRPLPALVALAAYYDQALESSLEKKSTRFELAKAKRTFLLTDGEDEELHWEDWPNGGGKTQVRTKNPNRGLLARAAARWNASVGIYNDAPPGWRKLAKEYSIPQMLREPAVGVQLTRGLLDPGWMRKSRLICFWPDDCLGTYLSAKLGGSLGNAIAYGSVSISAGTKPSCCSISLDDPDLRPMDDVVAEFLVARKVRNASDIGKSPRLMNELLELNSRLALKHLFVLNYIYNASPSLEPKERGR